MAGNITIVAPRENYLKVPKGIIYNDEVDALTLGIYVKVLALGTKWSLNIHGLAKTLHISVAKVKASFAILEKAGYIRRNRVKGKAGRFVGWDYEVYSEPITDIPENRPSENTDIGENRPSENEPLNRDNIIDRDNNTLNRDDRKGDFVAPTPDEVRDYAKSIHYYSLDAERFVEYYEATGWCVRTKSGQMKPMENWKLAVQTWKQRDKAKGNDISKPLDAPAPVPADNGRHGIKIDGML